MITATFVGYLAAGWTGAIVATVAIAAATLAVLLRWKVREPYMVAAGAIAGLALHWPW